MSALFTILFAVMPVCPTEDSSNCKWDASVQGNSVGFSFIDLNGETYKQVTR